MGPHNRGDHVDPAEDEIGAGHGAGSYCRERYQVPLRRSHIARQVTSGGLSRHGERDKVLAPSEIWGLLIMVSFKPRFGGAYFLSAAVAARPVRKASAP